MDSIRRLVPAALLLGTLAVPAAAGAEPLVGVDTRDRLVTFDSATPAKVRSRAISGLGAGEKVLGLDRRPANGALILVTSASRLYTLDATNGRAAAIGQGPLSPAIDGAGLGFDFNPAVDRIRLTTTNAQNLRLQPDTGAVAATDGTLAYAAGDVGAGTAPFVIGSAYTNSVPMAMSTQLFDIESSRDALVLQDPPNAGGLKTVGALGVAVTNPAGFDISGTSGTALLAARTPKRTGSRLYTVKLDTGAATLVGRIGTAKRPVTLRALSFS